MPANRLPWMKFWPDDWLADQQLRRCSPAARGLWVDVVCFMWKSDPRGYLQNSDGSALSEKQLALMLGLTPKVVKKLLLELRRNDVFSVTDGSGIIYSRRMVRDEAKRLQGSKNGKLGGNPILLKGDNPPDNPPDKSVVKGGGYTPEARSQKPDTRNPDLGNLDDGRKRKKRAGTPGEVLAWLQANGPSLGLNPDDRATQEHAFAAYLSAIEKVNADGDGSVEKLWTSKLRRLAAGHDTMVRDEFRDEAKRLLLIHRRQQERAGGQSPDASPIAHELANTLSAETAEGCAA